MSKKKYIPPDGEDVRRRRFRWLLRQKPKAYPDRPRSNKNSLLKSNITFTGGISMKKFTSCICSKANGLALRARMALSNQRGDFYISDAVKIIIAVVLGALLLAALTLIFNDTVIPRITQEIEGLFGAAN